MKRRSFVIALLAAPLGWSTSTQAKQLHISILHSGFPDHTPIHVLIQELDRVGRENRQDVELELHGAEGREDRLAALVSQIAARRADIIVAITTPAVRALKKAGVTIPVVFAIVTDPVGNGFVESLAHPGGNFTGVANRGPEAGVKRLEFVIEIMPQARRIAVVWATGEPAVLEAVDAIRRAAAARNLAVFAKQLSGPEDLEPALREAKKTGADAVVVGPDNITYGLRQRIAQQALVYRLPLFATYPPEARDGALMSYGIGVEETFRRAANFVDRILKGANPADLPVEEPTTLILAVNLRTAAALQLDIPPSILTRADEVIE